MEKDGTEDGRAGPIVRGYAQGHARSATHEASAGGAAPPVPAKRRKVESDVEGTRQSTGSKVGSGSARTTLPVLEHWGLDPLFWAHVKLFIGDVLAIPSFPGFIEPFNLHGHPVARVAVMGVVVEVLPRPNRVTLQVDDGTGCIQCTYFTNSIREGFVRTSELQIGCLVSIQGKLHQFRQGRSIAIYRIGIEEDPNAEAQHSLDVMRLMQTVYQRPSPIRNFVKTG